MQTIYLKVDTYFGAQNYTQFNVNVEPAFTMMILFYLTNQALEGFTMLSNFTIFLDLVVQRISLLKFMSVK